MPSFYSGHPSLGAQEYGQNYTPTGYSRGQDPHVGYAQYPQTALVQDKGFLLPDPYDPYKGPALPQPNMYTHQNAYNAGSLAIPQQVGAPMMEPVRMEDCWVGTQMASQGHYQERASQSHQHRQQQQPREEKSVGGVSQNLDYEMEQMTTFVADMTVETIARGVIPPENFRKWVLQVLNATRLPKATIFQSLSYLSLRVQMLAETGEFAPSERSLYQMLTIGLILGSKFLDDNTFQNKSWAEVSNIKVVELNREELLWLEGFGHRLHHKMDRSSGWNSWNEQWNRHLARAASLSVTLQAPQEQALRRQRSTPLNLTPNILRSQYQYPSPNAASFAVDATAGRNQYPTPTYTSYDPWYGPMSAVEKSPSTAPHSGPTTPEYYGTPGIWRRTDSYSRQHQYGYSGLQHYVPQNGYGYPGYSISQFQQGNQGPWNCHGAACQCGTCRSSQFQPQRYGPIVVS